MVRKLKLIAIDEENYSILKRRGNTGDSFNDVLTCILRRSASKPFSIKAQRFRRSESGSELFQTEDKKVG
jgi:predicted CopG family antitoxin